MYSYEIPHQCHHSLLYIDICKCIIYNENKRSMKERKIQHDIIRTTRKGIQSPGRCQPSAYPAAVAAGGAMCLCPAWESQSLPAHALPSHEDSLWCRSGPESQGRQMGLLYAAGRYHKGDFHVALRAAARIGSRPRKKLPLPGLSSWFYPFLIHIFQSVYL